MKSNSLKLNTSAGEFIIDTDTIVRIEASSNYSKLYFSNNKTLLTAKLLKWFEEKLQTQSFTRLHRSHLVNDNYLQPNQCLSKGIELTNGKFICVSRRRKKSVLLKLVAVFVMVLFCHSVTFSQNVGIGTVNPTGRLHIDLNGTTNPFAILIDDDDDPVVRFRRLGISKGFLEIRGNDYRIGTYATNDSGKLILATNSANRMYFTPAGNIGIGTADPISKFQITGGSDVSLTSNGYMMLGNANSTNVVFDNNEIQARNDSAASTLFFQASGGAAQIGASADNNIFIEGVQIQARYNGSDDVLVLQGLNGGKTRLGDGFDFANTKLHISTGVDAGLTPAQSGYMMIGLSTADNLVFDINEIMARNNGNPSTLYMARDGSRVQLGNGTLADNSKLQISSGYDVGLSNTENGYLMMGTFSGSNIAMDNNEIMARDNGSGATLYLQNEGGNVIIGDPAGFTSTHRLGVAGNAVVTGALRVGDAVTPSGYKLAVDGKMICTEVMVRLVPNWPDYVFNEKYKLPSIGEVESFIKINKHLPGIPSAATIEKEGLAIGEMQKMQMQKIEELTLYIIDMNKQLQSLKAENEQIKKQLLSVK